MQLPLLSSSQSADRDLSLKETPLMTESGSSVGNRNKHPRPLCQTNMATYLDASHLFSTIASNTFSIDRSHWYVPEFFQHSPNVVVVKAGLTTQT